ncbi:imidazolonepropionase [Aliivibrio fischeri]|uniref:imidazolonepropionase n=1 Tax=Aliivibrio fischeri TaxID=668 RepID=UPI0012D97AE3|nr:imidazolonepropionase [Aliivibrio fischeri]MUK92045.1 imidazolonepropionase [Aliivibrio fischeri]
MDRVFINLHLVSMVDKQKTDSDSYQVLKDAMIGVRNGKVEYVGEPCSSILHGHPDIIDCAHALVTPGFIDCHTHLIFAGNRANEFEQRLQGIPYEEIAKQGGGILSTVQATREASEDELYHLAVQRLEGLKRDGVTTIEIKSGYGLTLDDEIKMLKVAKRISELPDMKVSTTLLAAHAVPPEYKNRSDEYIDLICDSIIPQVVKLNLANHVDVFCEGIGFSPKQCERVFRAALNHGLRIKGHTEQLSNLEGSALAASMGADSVDHIEYLDENGVKALAKNNTVATLLPGAFYYLKESKLPPIPLLRQYKVPMAIATDFNPGTSPIASLRTIMNMACTLFKLTPEESLRGVTCHAAQALGLQHFRGKIAVGMEADFAIWQLESPAELSYRLGVPDLIARVVNGEIFHEK